MVEAIKDKVIVKLMKRVHDGNIVVPDSAVMDPQLYGEVLSVGEEVGEAVKKGEVVVFHPSGGQAIVLKEQVLSVVKIEEVYGKLTDKDTLRCLKSLKIGKQEEEGRIVQPNTGGIIGGVK